MPSPELLTLKEFAEIWKQYPKEDAITIFSYIFFSYSHSKKNIFLGYSEQERPLKVISSLSGSDETLEMLKNPTELIINAAKRLIQSEDEASPSMAYYKSALVAAQKMQDFFNTFDIRQKNLKTGAPFYKPSDITRALKETSDVLRTLQSLREKVEQESFEESRARKQRKVNRFEV